MPLYQFLLTRCCAGIASINNEMISDQSELENPNIPKIALGENGLALYFSRSVIPHIRNLSEELWVKEAKHYKHIGIYGYRSDILTTICELQSSILEQMEQLEQLRWLANGLRIKAIETKHDTISIDTSEDLERAIEYLNKKIV